MKDTIMKHETRVLTPEAFPPFLRISKPTFEASTLAETTIAFSAIKPVIFSFSGAVLQFANTKESAINKVIFLI